LQNTPPTGTLLENRPLPVIFLKIVFCFENNSELMKYKRAIQLAQNKTNANAFVE